VPVLIPVHSTSTTTSASPGVGQRQLAQRDHPGRLEHHGARGVGPRAGRGRGGEQGRAHAVPSITPHCTAYRVRRVRTRRKPAARSSARSSSSRRARPRPIAHRVEAEVDVAHHLGPARAGERLGDHDAAAARQRVAHATQQREHRLVVVVEEHAHERHHVGAAGERLRVEVAPVHRDAVRQPRVA
jgi:hypothetical protein